jgi:UDP-N-acetylmuramyl pentapeptide phosphotransferase/UDP-N-acetylglucosamine-1-phosphate transferase
MHTAPVVTGAGAAIIASAIAIWVASSPGALKGDQVLLLGAAALLAGVSWFDDHGGGLSPGLRLATHLAAVALLLLSLEQDQRIVPSIPLVAERLLLGLAWVWFINLFNFMDGIDGLAGSETVVIALGYFLVITSAGMEGGLTKLGVIIGAAAAGYLIWNWHPARVMMGDAGSIALGFLLGWLMIDLALRGLWAASVILPLYFAADATLTLAARMVRAEKPWQPHRAHFYQRAVLAGASPAAVVSRITVANFALVMLAVLSIRFPAFALAGAVAVVTALIAHLAWLAR